MEKETKSSIVEKPTVSEEKKESTPTEMGRETNESFLGSLLVVTLVLLLIGVTGFFGFFGYRMWRESQIVENTPSIERMAVEKTAVAPVAEPKGEASKEEAKPVEEASKLDKATFEVKVMNGGAAKGSAGTFMETLKKAGYTKATVGNTVGNYTGTTIYFALDKEKEAEALKLDVAKTYPAVTVAKAVTTNKDTTAALLTVILGK